MGQISEPFLLYREGVNVNMDDLGLSSFYNELLQELEEMKKEIKKEEYAQKEAKRQMKRAYKKEMKKKIKKICDTAIDKFYASYTPKSYNRTESLYDVCSFSGDYVIIGSDKLDGHRAKNEYIYQLTILNGFHGGGIPKEYENMNNPIYRYGKGKGNENENEWVGWSYFDVAPRTTPTPYEYITAHLNERSLKKIANETATELFNKYYEKYRR